MQTMYYHFIKLYLGDFYDGDRIPNCPRSCQYMDISFGYPSTYDVSNPSDSVVTMYFRTFIPVRESHIEYSGASLLADIGGYTGLLLGVSLLDITTLISFFSEKMNQFGIRLCSRCQNKDEQQE